MAVDFFGEDGARLSPANVPVAFVGGEDYAFALPSNQIGRSNETKLRVLLVVTRVSEIVRVVDFLEARGFHSAVFFIWSLGGNKWNGTTNEMETVGAFGVAET